MPETVPVDLDEGREGNICVFVQVVCVSCVRACVFLCAFFYRRQPSGTRGAREGMFLRVMRGCMND